MTGGPPPEPPPPEAPAPPGRRSAMPPGVAGSGAFGPGGRGHWIRRLAKLWGFAAFLIFVVVLFRHVALPFVFAIVVAYIIAPLINGMAGRAIGGWSVPRPLAVMTVYLAFIAVVSGFLYVFIPRLAQDFSRLFREAPRFFEKVNQEYVPRAATWAAATFGTDAEASAPRDHVPTPEETSAHSRFLVVPRGNGTLEVRLEGIQLEVREARDGYLVAPRVPKPTEPPGERWERSLREAIAEAAQSGEEHLRDFLALGKRIITGTLAGLASVILTLMVTAFIVVDMDRIHAFLRSLISQEYQHEYDKVLEGIDRGLSGVIRGQLVICLVNGTLTYLGLVIFNVKYAILLGAVAAVMSLIPIFGSILSSVPIVAIAMVSTPAESVSLVNGVLVLGWIVLIHLIEANYLNPKIMGTAAKIHPVIVVFALIAGERTYGLVGALLAVPVASIIQTFFLYFRRRAWQSQAGSDPQRISVSP